ncbi:uncharacterized protein [Palaemon carinicauda]|uniref:uncharacterized protein n=1 Tax=Palaemon carinicauda TaxID=392227 RepID=UPI0035B6163B
MEIETTDDAARFLSRDNWRSKLFTIKKSELLVVSDYLELDFTLSSTNDDIRKGIIAHLVPDGVDVDFKLLEEEIDEDCEVVKLRLKLDLKKLEFEDEQKRREHELSMKQLENEQQKRDHELELARLTGSQSPISGNEDSRMLKYVPKFDESDVVEFFIAFEKVAANFNWSEDKWAFMAQTAFSGKALKAWASLSLEDSKDYAKAKEAILRIYEMVPEAYRVKFCDSRKSSNQTFVEFAREMEKHFENWLRSSDVKSEYAKLCQLMLLENFKHNLPQDLCIFLDEKKIDNLASAARLADGYVITHNSYSKPAAKGKYNTCETVKLPTGVNVTANDGNQFKSSPASPQKHFKSKYQGRVTCFCCGKNGHIATKCPKRDSAMLVNNKQIVDDDFKWFKSQGKISTLESWQEGHNVNVLRDTGSSQSLILRKAIPVGSKWLNEHKLIKGVGNEWISCPVVELYFFSDIVAREAKFAVVDTLPIPEVDVVLANDLAQGKVSCNPTVFANPQVLVPKPETVLVTTRSGKSTDFEVEHPDLESLFNADSLDHVSNKKSMCSEKVMNWNRDDLVRVQNEDIEIKNIKIKLKEGKGVDYEVGNEVLYKVILPIRKGEGNLLKHRVIVVPSKFRNGILRKAHDDLFAGHLGITKTFDRVRKNFYWKGLKRDVKKYCKTCHQCQISGKPNMVIPKAPLSPIPSLGEPFEHVVIDVVGPLPRSKVGSEYILTIIDRLTRYPEAIPLKSQKARVIAKHLINYFSRFGLPKTIQSDRGTNFLSKLLLQQFKNFGIEHKPSTPYHPESQGIVERFHQTLKAMIRKMCNEKVGLWEEYLPYLLFAVRSIPNESTNFAPFNLVFAHKVRGPLDLLREVWEGNGPSEVNIADLINDGKGKIYEMWEIAKSNLLKSQSKMKSLYDLKSKERVFVPGDKVLVLSQGVRGSLQNKFLGPFEVLSKVNDLNYIIKLPDRNLQCHINMLKKYFEPEKTVVLSVSEEVNSKCVTSEKEFAWPGNNSVLLPNVCRSPILSTNQINGLLKVLMKFPETVRDTPGRTTLVQHDVELESETPIKQAPYRLNPVKKEFVEKEINYLLTNNLITPSSSSWSSPIVVVAKENGQSRLCIDYRKVNKATKADSFPIPRVDDCIDKVGNSKFITKIDLLKGYYQVPLSNRAKEVSAFVTADGLYQFEVMPFGMRNAAATFQRLMAMVTRGIKNCVVYIDDIIVYSNDFETHLVILEELLTALSNAGLVINLSKSVFCEATVTFLGHVVGKGEVLPKEVNVAKIKEFPVPSSKRELQRFLGMAGYYSRFVANYSDVIAPLTNLLRKHSKFVWDDKCKESFEIVKCVLTSSPVLRAPNFELPFSLAVDASDQGVGAVLLQVCEDGVNHPISYFSKKLNKHQVKYSVIEKEALALILALLHFEAYISAQSGEENGGAVYSVADKEYRQEIRTQELDNKLDNLEQLMKKFFVE